MTIKLQFTHQDYQTRTVEAVVKVFAGQPLAKSDFALAAQQGSVAYAGDGSIGRRPHRLRRASPQRHQAQGPETPSPSRTQHGRCPALAARHSQNRNRASRNQRLFVVRWSVV